MKDDETNLKKGAEYYNLLDKAVLEIFSELRTPRKKNDPDANRVSNDELGHMLTALTAYASVLVKFLTARGADDSDLDRISDLAQSISDDVWAGCEEGKIKSKGVLIRGPSEPS